MNIRSKIVAILIAVILLCSFAFVGGAGYLNYTQNSQANRERLGNSLANIERIISDQIKKTQVSVGLFRNKETFPDIIKAASERLRVGGQQPNYGYGAKILDLMINQSKEMALDSFGFYLPSTVEGEFKLQRFDIRKDG